MYTSKQILNLDIINTGSSDFLTYYQRTEFSRLFHLYLLNTDLGVVEYGHAE